VTVAQGAAIGVAAFASSAINAGAGGGSFISFPVLLGVGLAPVNANATNTVATWLGSLSSIGSFRSEVRVERRVLLAMLGTSVAGSLLGAWLLIRTPNGTFAGLIPILLAFATTLFIVGPTFTRLARGAIAGLRVDSPLGFVAQFCIAIYGGFFGAAIGILMLALLGLLGMNDLRRANALKVVLAAVINGVDVIPFALAGKIDWAPLAIMGLSAIAGGYLGAGVVKRLPPVVVRRFVIAVGVTMTAYFAWKTYAV